MIPDGEYDECRECDGTGRDPAEWDGRCIYCGGKGDVWQSWPDDDDGFCSDLDCEACG